VSGNLIIEEECCLPQLTRIKLYNHCDDDGPPPFLSALSAALPALRELDCGLRVALDDMPPLPPSLTRLCLRLSLCPPCGYFAPGFNPNRAFRWTDASPLSACPQLTSLELYLRFFDCPDDPPEGGDLSSWSNRELPYRVEVPEGLPPPLEQFTINMRCVGCEPLYLRASESIVRRTAMTVRYFGDTYRGGHIPRDHGDPSGRPTWVCATIWDVIE
jgi:hypothetical protein